MKATFNFKITNRNISEVGFLIVGLDKEENLIYIDIRGDKGKKQYVGSYLFNIDISHYYFNDYIELQKYYGNDYIIFDSFMKKVILLLIIFQIKIVNIILNISE